MNRLVHIDGLEKVKILNLLIQLGSIDRSGQFGHHVHHAAEIQGRWRQGGAHAGGREGRGFHAGR